MPSRSLAALVLCAASVGTAAQQSPPAWVTRSNEHTRAVLEAQARIAPEGVAQVGLEGYDEQITDLSAGFTDRVRASTAAIAKDLDRRLAGETDPLVRQDLEILIEATRQQLASLDTAERLVLPYVNAPQAVFGGLRALLDDQVAPARRRAALVRLRKYAGAEPGFTPLTELALARMRERLARKELLGPFAGQIERDLGTIPFLASGLKDLFTKYDMAEAAPLLEKLGAQFAAYEKAIRAELLPRARQDFKLPAELYADNLRQYGVDIPPAELAAAAHRAYDEIQKQMQQVAAEIARERKLPSADYRAVIAALKKEQLVGDAILAHYQERLKQVEGIIARERLVTLPARPARIRIATPAESAQQPAPSMRPPRLVGNQGEQGEFVLPLNMPSTDASKAKQLDDFTFAASSWTLTAHETRPGHELQFAAMVEQGVSQARAIYAFNSTNVEGWGLYAEYILQPFMPREGQLISLQHRLMRAARAFSDPELQSGATTPEQVKRLLMTDVVLSDAMATQEVERYTFRAPGQATSYFYGYTRLLELRGEVERAQGSAFDARRFHDFVLAQGLLPPQLLRTAVMERFLKSDGR